MNRNRRRLVPQQQHSHGSVFRAFFAWPRRVGRGGSCSPSRTCSNIFLLRPHFISFSLCGDAHPCVFGVCACVCVCASLARVRPTQHLVEKSDTHEQFALKRIDLEAQSPSEKKATLLEVRLLSRLVHPYVISLVDHFHDGNSLCLVMPLAPDDLDKELRRTKKSGTRLAEARVLDLLAEVGAALHYLHGCRVVHRDLKPANILLAEDGTARLADLGIACTLAAGALQLGRALKRSPASEERE